MEGEVKKAKSYDIEELIKLAPLEERIYRLRCVEAWSMVIPWVGFPLSALVKLAEPTSNAKFIQFVTLNDPKRLPGQKLPDHGMALCRRVAHGRSDAPADDPLGGSLRRGLPAQNGAPIRLVVPWKYGFKSIKSIVKIRFVEKQPPHRWNMMQPQEYGFYSNVNPEVDHPRWTPGDRTAHRRILPGARP